LVCHVHHVHIFASDIEKSIKFYEEFFGGRVILDLELAGARVEVAFLISPSFPCSMTKDNTINRDCAQFSLIDQKLTVIDIFRLF